jgi:CRISPR-associated protein Cas2
MRSRYLVTYDIADPKRLRRVFRLMCGYGEHLQFSVFECDLSSRERMQLETELMAVLDLRADQVLFADLGPSDGRGAECIAAVGRPYIPMVRGAVVV